MAKYLCRFNNRGKPRKAKRARKYINTIHSQCSAFLALHLQSEIELVLFHNLATRCPIELITAETRRLVIRYDQIVMRKVCGVKLYK